MYCEQCGKKLEDNEVCACQAANTEAIEPTAQPPVEAPPLITPPMEAPAAQAPVEAAQPAQPMQATSPTEPRMAPFTPVQPVEPTPYTPQNQQYQPYSQPTQGFQHQQPGQPPQGFQQQPFYNTDNGDANCEEVRALTRNALRSKLFFWAAVLFTIMLAFSMISTAINTASLSSPELRSQVIDTLLELDMDYNDINEIMEYYDMYADNATGVTAISLLLNHIVPLLCCIGLWLAYNAAGNTSNVNVSTTGITMIKVVQRILYILLFIVLGIAVVAMMIAIGALNSSNVENSGVLAGALAFVLFFIVGAVVLLIFYYRGIMNTLTCIKESLVYGRTRKMPSIFLAVMFFIAAGSSCLSGLMSGDVLLTITGFIETAFYIVAGRAILDFKNQLSMTQRGW